MQKLFWSKKLMERLGFTRNVRRKPQGIEVCTQYLVRKHSQKEKIAFNLNKSQELR
jgi:hypothetical protein